MPKKQYTKTITARKSSFGLQIQQKGSVLIEALLAALIFALASIGALGMIAGSAQSAGDMRSRMEASAFAEDIVGRMQADLGNSIANIKQYDHTMASQPPYLEQWNANVAAKLPLSKTCIIVDDTFAGGIGAEVTVRINWVPAGGNSNTPQDATCAAFDPCAAVAASCSSIRTYTLNTVIAPS